jgi:geranylgeranyl pyrophosphate synthase
MYEKLTAEERCQKILEDNGQMVADQARKILLEDPALKGLKTPLKFISRNWRDPLTPALMRLSCEAVGGHVEETHEASLALSLMNLSFFVWDDIIDEARSKLFKPTLFGKFGEGIAIIIGGVAAAKAFSIHCNMNMDETKHQRITRLLWDLWAKIARAETSCLRSRNYKIFSLKEKIWKIKTEATDLETCMKIGAIIGNAAESEIECLGKYGKSLGIIFELLKDFQVSVNLTLELAEKIRRGALPYSLLWAREHSKKLRKKLDLAIKNPVEASLIKEVIENVLETKAVDNTLKVINVFTKKGRVALAEINKNRATLSLKLLVEAQPQLFIDIIRRHELGVN